MRNSPPDNSLIPSVLPTEMRANARELPVSILSRFGVQQASPFIPQLQPINRDQSKLKFMEAGALKCDFLMISFVENIHRFSIAIHR